MQKDIERTQRALDEKFIKGEVKRLFLPEIIEGFLHIPEENLVSAIKANSNLYSVLGRFLQLVYDERINFVVDRSYCETIIKKRNIKLFDNIDYDVVGSNLFAELRKTNYIIEGTVSNREVNPVIIEKILYILFSLIHADEVELFFQMLDRNIKGLKRECVVEALPHLFSKQQEKNEERVEEEKADEKDVKEVPEMPMVEENKEKKKQVGRPKKEKVDASL